MPDIHGALHSFEDVPALLAAHSVPGLSFASLSSESKGPTTLTWGIASEKDNRRITPDTLFRVASLSKPVTALAVLRLAGMGQLDLDADVNSLLRTWKVPSVGGWQPAVSARMLLAHVAGTGGWGDNSGYADREPPETLIDVLEGLGDSPALTFHTLPNVMWHYSSGGYHVLQQLVADTTGAEFSSAVDQLVLEPLGMSSTTFEAPLPERLRAVAAYGHFEGVSMRPCTKKDPAVAAEGMWSTASDLMRFARAVNDGAAPEMLVGHPVEPRMGLGLFLNADTGITWWSHTGSVPGFQSLMAGAADANFACAALTNSSTGGPVVKRICELAAHLLGPGPLSMHDLLWEGIEAAIQMNKHHLDAVGSYRLPGGLTVELSATSPDRWGQRSITLTLPGQPSVQLAPPFADGHWRVPGFESVLVFEAPDVLCFRQAGREVVARRSSFSARATSEE